MTFWQYYWVITGLFCWSVFGMALFVTVGCELLERYSEIRSYVMVAMILLAGPLAWLMAVVFALEEFRTWWRNR